MKPRNVVLITIAATVLVLGLGARLACHNAWRHHGHYACPAQPAQGK